MAASNTSKQFTQTVPTLKALTNVFAVSMSWVNTPAASPYWVEFARRTTSFRSLHYTFRISLIFSNSNTRNCWDSLSHIDRLKMVWHFISYWSPSSHCHMDWDSIYLLGLWSVCTSFLPVNMLAFTISPTHFNSIVGFGYFRVILKKSRIQKVN